MIEASGAFEVQFTPQSDEGPIGRALLSKTFSGDLAGTSTGTMLSFRSTVNGSAGYVAMERVSGTVGGRTGTFVLQHSGLMDRGKSTLTVAVVPDSGTDGLVGLNGSMDIDGANHGYTFRYGFDAIGG